MSDEKESQEGTPEDREKIIKALKEGRVEWGSEGKKYFERAGVIAIHNPDFTIVEVTLASCWGPFKDKKGEQVNQGGFDVSWSSVSAGFGRVTFHISNEGKLMVETQRMDKAFCLSVLEKLLASAEVIE